MVEITGPEEVPDEELDEAEWPEPAPDPVVEPAHPDTTPEDG